MNTLHKKICDQKNGLTYTLHGDYYLPELKLFDNDKTPIGRYGRMRLNYLRKHRPGLYTRLLLSGKLYGHLSEIDRICKERLGRMVPQMANADGIDETLKSKDPMTWVARMNNIHQRVEETILTELIYE